MPIHNGPSIGDVIGLPSALRMGKFVDRGNFFALCGQNATWSDGTNGVQSARWPATFNTDCTGLQFCYANWIAGPTEQANTNAVIIRASLETPAGTYWQFLFNGRKGAVVDGGAQILSDPLSIPLLASLGKVYYRITVAVALPPSSLAAAGSASGGTLAAGTYYWKVTTVTSAGESTAYTEVSYTASGSTSSAALTWTPNTQPDITILGYNVYRGTATNTETLLTFVANPFATGYTDTGALSPGATAVPAALKWGLPSSFSTSYSDAGDVSSTTYTDMTSSGSFSTNTRHNAPVAAAIFARPLYQRRIPNIAIIGDSIGSGTSDTSYYAGYPQYGIIRAGNLAFINLAIGSDAAVTWGTLANCYRRAALAEDCDWAMNEHGVNDLQADPTSMMVNMMALDLRLSQLGMRVCHPTITPRTTSATSNWIGTYNQVAFDVRCGPTYALQGTATSGAAGSITDSAKTLNTAPYSTSYASFVGYYVSIESGTGAGQRRKITGVTGTSQINVTPNWTVTPDATSAYVIRCTRVEYNDWVRAGCPVDATFTAPRPTGTVGGVPNPWVYAYVEIADSVESARNSCLWGWQQNATGTATGGTTTTLVNSGASWTTNQWQNLKVSIVGGTGAGQIATIASNTATTLTFGALTTAPDATSQYIIGLDYTSGVHMTGTGNAVAGAALQAAAPSTFILY